jgi:hypothetical protein
MTITLNNINYDIENDTFIKNVTIFDFVRYIKGIYTNKERFVNNFLNYFITGVQMYDRPDRIENLKVLDYYYDLAKPFSYKEAFEIADSGFKALVFGSINIVEMINNLDVERISVEGKLCKHKVYNEDKTFKYEENNLIYELYKINLKNIGVEATALAVKCWCTTTNKEHWIWVDDKYETLGALEAIASTCVVYEDMIPFIKSIKRQGDVFIFEMTKQIIPTGNKVSLTAKQYFDLIVAQS